MEDEIIDDGENFSANGQNFGFKEIVMMQLQRVVQNYSKEMRPGFWIRTQTPSMTPQKLRYIGDSRMELIQSLKCLHDLLMPKFDKEMKDATTKIHGDIKPLNNTKDNDFKEGILEIYRKMFQELCLFLNRKGWLAAKEIDD